LVKRNVLYVVVACTCSTLGAERASGPDRVGFPAEYAEQFEVLRTVSMKEKLQVGTVYGNEAAASITRARALAYPNGSVIVMEWRAALEDSAGQPLLGPSGDLRKGDVVRLDVMRRERGFGEAYGKDRAGDWEFASYGPGGAALTPPADPAACARCHKGAGAAKDFVFRGRFEAPKQ
jgi:hypothetical protein